MLSSSKLATKKYIKKNNLKYIKKIYSFYKTNDVISAKFSAAQCTMLLIYVMLRLYSFSKFRVLSLYMHRSIQLSVIKIVLAALSLSFIISSSSDDHTSFHWNNGLTHFAWRGGWDCISYASYHAYISIRGDVSLECERSQTQMRRSHVNLLLSPVALPTEPCPTFSW